MYPLSCRKYAPYLGHLETFPIIILLATCVQQGAKYFTIDQSTPTLQHFM